MSTTIPTPTPLTPGTRVGAQRWPYAAAHVDCWQAPHVGTLLAEDDPDAWAGTIAFPQGGTQEAVTAHVARCRADFGPSTTLPVRWDFGQIYWETITNIVPAEVDLALWHAARDFARATRSDRAAQDHNVRNLQRDFPALTERRR